MRQRGNRLYTLQFDVCIRQVLTYKDGPRNERINIFLIAVYPFMCIQMKRKELAKTFMMILNRNKPPCFPWR